MHIKKHIYIILSLSALFTLVINLDLTRSIIFDDYLSTGEIAGGGTAYYLSLINESSKGNWSLGSPYFLEWRYAPYLYPALNINAAGLFKQVSGLDIKMYSLAMDYICIFIIMALILAAFLLLFQFNYFGYLAATFYIFFPWHTVWSRTLSPEINFIPFVLFLIFYFSRFSFWKRELALAFLAGILFYIYPYYWTFALVLLGISDLFEFWKQKKIIWEHLYKYSIIGGMAVWYLAHLWQISHLPYYQETMARIGFLHSRLPAGWYTQAVLLGSLILFFLFLKYASSIINSASLAGGFFYKSIAGLVAGLIVLNQQLITNVQMEFNSHYLPIILFFLISFYGGLIFASINFIQKHFYKKICLAALAILAVLIIGYAAFLELGGGSSDSFGNKDSKVINWFIQNQIQDKVVYAPQELNDDINVLTGNYLYFSGSQELQLMPTAELIDRFTYFDVLNREITDNLIGWQGLVFGQIFKSVWQKDSVVNKVKAKIAGRDFTPATLTQYTKYDFGPMREKRINPDPVEFNQYLEKYHVSYLVYRQKDRYGIYASVSGKIVFEDKNYLIKKLE